VKKSHLFVFIGIFYSSFVVSVSYAAFTPIQVPFQKPSGTTTTPSSSGTGTPSPFQSTSGTTNSSSSSSLPGVSSTIVTPIPATNLVTRSPVLSLVAAGTVTVTTNPDGSLSAACPAGSILGGLSNNSSLVYMYNPKGKADPIQYTCTAPHQCYAGEFQSGISCWCAGSANSCCNSAFYDCNYTEQNQPCPQTYSSSGAWGSRSAITGSTPVNAPDITTNGTCYYPVVTWVPSTSVTPEPTPNTTLNIPQN